jgi:hypothetical protein
MFLSALRRRALDKAAGAREDMLKHGVGEAASLRVLLAWMIRRDQPEIARQPCRAPVAENGSGGGRRLPCLNPRPQEGIKCDPAQRDDDPQLAKQTNFFHEVGSARRTLTRCGLVAGWGTPDGRGDAAPLDRQAIIPVARPRLIRKACTMQGAVQKVPAPIAREDAPCSVPSVRRRSKPNDQ